MARAPSAPASAIAVHRKPTAAAPDGRRFQQIFADGIATGEFAADLNPELATLGLLGLCNSVIAARSLPPTATIDDFVAEYSRIFIHGASAEPRDTGKGTPLK